MFFFLCSSVINVIFKSSTKLLKEFRESVNRKFHIDGYSDEACRFSVILEIIAENDQNPIEKSSHLCA